MKIKNKTAGHAGIACFSFALKGNRAGSPHFKIVRFKWWEHVTNICKQLQLVSQFTIHYRIKNGNDILRYRMKCARIGNADTFEKIVFAFASEDSDIRLDELGIMNLSSTGEKRKILIVENDVSSLKFLISLLEDRYEIITACDGKIGLRLLEENHKDLALVLINFQIPVLSGFDFLRKVQEDTFLSLIPIIVMTANDTPKTEVICLNLGATDYIRKPYNAELIRKRLENVIKLRESSVSLREIEKDSLTGLYTEQAFYDTIIMKAILIFTTNRKSPSRIKVEERLKPLSIS